MEKLGIPEPDGEKEGVTGGSGNNTEISRYEQSLTFYNHIFQNAQVTSNKIVHKKKHHFLGQFSIPFHMVRSVLFRVLTSKTIEWKLLIGCQRISIS